MISLKESIPLGKHGAAGCKRGKHCPFYIAYRNRKLRKKWRIARWQQ